MHLTKLGANNSKRIIRALLTRVGFLYGGIALFPILPSIGANGLPRERRLCILVNVVCREAENRGELFVSTCWTIVLKAGDSPTSAQALSALSELCQIYWRPLYIFLRKKGYGHEDAQDREHALKRGGGMILQKLDDKMEAQIARAAKWQADEVYDREWASSLVRQALDRLAQECALTGKGERFGYFVPYLAAREESAIPFEEMARRSHRSVNALRHELARLRARYRAILRQEVRGTVREVAEVDEELRYLCHTLAAA